MLRNLRRCTNTLTDFSQYFHWWMPAAGLIEKDLDICRILTGRRPWLRNAERQVRCWRKKAEFRVGEGRCADFYIYILLAGFPALTLSYISNSSISLDWSDFHIRHRRKDDIASYKVYYGLSSSEQVDEVTVDANQDRLLLTGEVAPLGGVCVLGSYLLAR